MDEQLLLLSMFMTLTGCASPPPATLDSAVTLGQHGAKNFLMRDGKEVVQCIFYENVSHGVTVVHNVKSQKTIETIMLIYHLCGGKDK